MTIYNPFLLHPELRYNEPKINPDLMYDKFSLKPDYAHTPIVLSVDPLSKTIISSTNGRQDKAHSITLLTVASSFFVGKAKLIVSCLFLLASRRISRSVAVS
jgi:hypothetical protein